MMSDAGGPEGPSVDLPREQNQPPQQPLWYPSYVTRATLAGSYLNVLLVFVPVGIVAGALGWGDVAVFFLNALAMIPLAPLIALSTWELSANVGWAFGGLLNIALSNAVKTIVGIIAVSRGEILIVQSGLIGSILFESLLVLGSCFFFAGYGKESIKFDQTLTNIMSSLMMVTSVILIVPTTMSPELLPSDILEVPTESNSLIISRSIAIILFILFVIYLFFQLKTHADLYLDPLDDGNITNQERHNRNVAGEEQGPTLSPWVAIFVLITSIGCVIKCASYFVDSIGGSVDALDIGRTFIGLVILPTIGNTAKFVTVVTLAMKNRIDFTIRAILGSVLQITFVIAPFLVLLGWILEKPMILSFDIFGASVFLLAVMVVNYVIQDGKTNYFEGFMLVGTYIIVVAAFYIRPDPEE